MLEIKFDRRTKVGMEELWDGRGGGRLGRSSSEIRRTAEGEEEERK